MPGGSDSRAPTLEEDVKWMAAVAVAARRYHLKPADVMNIRGHATRACGPMLEARRAAIYLANCGANMGSRALRRATGMHRQNIRNHLRWIEDHRDVAAELDLLMDDMTAQVQHLVGMGRAA